MKALPLLLPLLVACTSSGAPSNKDRAGGDDADSGATGSDGSDGSDGADGADGSDGSDGSDGAADSGAVASLHGDIPDSALPLPTFEATNRDGTPRNQNDLLTNPTVMWFYPAAATGG
jgi:hypothetical protein